MDNQIEHTSEKVIESHQLPSSQENKVSITPAEMMLYMEKLKLEQNLPLSLISGIGACLLGAILWLSLLYYQAFK